MSLSFGLVTHWFPPHHHRLHHQQLHLPSSSYPEKEWAKSLLGCHYASFLTRLFVSLELFSNSPLSAWPALTRSSLPPGHNENHLVWVHISLVALIEVKPPVWLFWEPSDLSGLTHNSPPWLGVKFPLSVFLGQLTYTIFYCTYILHFDLLQFFFSSFSPILSSNVKFSITVWLLSDYCSITVQYSDRGNVFQVFRSCKL